ncbi:MAG: ABC transporter permease [Thermotogae bacterium]|jgi:ABC-type transport system involved in multi-copper enzyme maturation permease subunit|nr:ABC transporter permease [Thermotogota bacterium]
MILSKKEYMFIKTRWIVMVIIMIGLAIMTVSIKDILINLINTPAVQEQLKNIPKGLQSQIQKISDFSYYSYSQWFDKTFIEIAAVLAVIFSFSAFSKEIEDRTLYILHGRSTRFEMFSAKIFWGIVACVISILAGGLVYLTVADILKYNLPISQAMIWTGRTIFGTIFLYSIGIFFSLILKDQVRAILADLAVFVGIYVLGIFAQTRFLGIFDYMGSIDVLNGSGIGIIQIAILLILSCLLLGFTYFKFKNMDI